MIPLTTRQGLATIEMTSLINGRDVLIWGTGDLAQDVLTSLSKAGIRPKAFLHTSATPGGKTLHNLPVRMVEDALSPAPGADFIVLATPTFQRQAEARCLQAGYRKNIDFVSHLSITRPHAIVDIANNCHLQCLGCPRQTLGPHPHPAFMDAVMFARVLDKLTSDVPLLCHLELALWGEPLLNPDLPSIIQQAQRVVPCTVATGLAVEVSVDPIVQAQPSRFDITAFGFGQSYEDSVPGASWELFTQQLLRLKQSIERHKPRTRFQVRLYRTRQDTADLERQWRDLLQDSAIGLSLQVPYVMPYDHVLSRCETGAFPHHLTRVVEALPWDMDHVLAQCQRDRLLPCLSQRIFPVINTDLSVSQCHLYNEPIVASDYLSILWDDLLFARNTAIFCERCQNFGLHRLDIDVLERRYPKNVSDLSV